MTLLSTITNEAINDNLKARFNNQEIYVSWQDRSHDLS
jgi:myosin-1